MKKILLVEDNSDDIELMKRAMRKSTVKCELKVVMDGLQAIEYLKSKNINEYMPNLIILDLNLPKISGLDLLKKIRSMIKFKNIPIVVLSTSREESDLLRAYQLHSKSYIRKPVGFSKFMHVLDRVIEYWLDINKLPNFQIEEKQNEN